MMSLIDEISVVCPNVGRAVPGIELAVRNTMKMIAGASILDFRGQSFATKADIEVIFYFRIYLIRS